LIGRIVLDGRLVGLATSSGAIEVRKEGLKE